MYLDFRRSKNKHQHQSHNFTAEHAPAHLLVCFLHESLHVVVDLDHFLIGLLDIASYAIKCYILLSSLSLEILCLSLDDISLGQDSINNLILLSNMILLLLKDLLVVKVACVWILSIFFPLVANHGLLFICHSRLLVGNVLVVGGLRSSGILL